MSDGHMKRLLLLTVWERLSQVPVQFILSILNGALLYMYMVYVAVMHGFRLSDWLVFLSLYYRR